MSAKILLLNNNQIEKKINRLAYQIYENNYLEKELLIIGLAKKGYLFAEKLSQKLTEISKFPA